MKERELFLKYRRHVRDLTYVYKRGVSRLERLFVELHEVQCQLVNERHLSTPCGRPMTASDVPRSFISFRSLGQPKRAHATSRLALEQRRVAALRQGLHVLKEATDDTIRARCVLQRTLAGEPVDPSETYDALMTCHIIRAYLIYFTELSCVGFSLQLTAVRGLSLEGVYSFRSYY